MDNIYFDCEILFCDGSCSSGFHLKLSEILEWINTYNNSDIDNIIINNLQGE